MLETLLSVIIPVYNVEPYLEQCLDSVINQTYKNMEIICVNDGSTDNSPKILEKYKLKDKRIKVISQKNKGLSEARNVGIKIAKGKYIGFVDSDDFIEPTMYEKLVMPMIKDPSIDFSEANIKCFFEKGGNHNYCPDSIKTEGKYKMRLDNTIPFHVVVWNKVYKKSIIQEQKIDFPKGLYHEDYSFSPAYFVNSKYVYCIPDRLYNYRIRKDSICGREKNEEKYKKQKIDEWKAHLYFYEYLKKRGLFEQHKNYLKQIIMTNASRNTFYIKWPFIKEFCKFLVESDYPISEKIFLANALVQGVINLICKLYSAFLS